LEFVVLPIIIVGHEIIIDLFFYYGGKVGLENITPENFIRYFSAHMAELGIVIVIAIVIIAIIETILKQIEEAH
jgi:hypothetical protein